MILEAACFLFSVCSHETGLGVSYCPWPFARVVVLVLRHQKTTGQGNVGYTDCPSKASTNLFSLFFFG